MLLVHYAALWGKRKDNEGESASNGDFSFLFSHEGTICKYYTRLNFERIVAFPPNECYSLN